MLGQISEVAPKTLLIGLLIWALINWAFLGPELGARQIRADGHIEQCERGYGEAIAAIAQEEIEKIEPPRIDAQREFAARNIREQLRGPMGQLFRMTGQQGMLDDALATYEQEKKAAVETYARAVAAVKEKTTAKLGKSGDYCGCVADAAVSSAQNDFAIYSGTLTFFRPAGIRDLDVLMKRAAGSNACEHLKG